MLLLRTLILIAIVTITIVQATKLDCAKKGSSRSPTLKLKKKILCDYDTEYRPVLDKKRATNVTVYMVLKGVEADYGNIPSAAFVFWMGFKWTDEFLTWKPEDYDGVDAVHITSDEIWSPDVQQFNKEKSKIKVLDGTDCLVTNTGVVSCVAEAYHSGLCDSNIEAWPFDTMTCVLKYTSGAYDASEMRLSMHGDGIRLNAYTDGSDWKLIGSGSKKLSYKVKDELYNELRYNFTLQRQNAMITSTIFIPALSLITMSLVPLLLQAGKVERLSIVAVNILTHLLFIQHLHFLAPYAGETIPTRVLFFRDSLVISVLVLVELTLIKVLISNRGPTPAWLITPCKFVSSGVFGRVLLTEEPQEIRDEENGTQIDQKQITMKKLCEEKTLISSVCDKLCFIILFIIYLSMVIRLLK